MSAGPDDSNGWPALPYAEWAETCTALHLWTQIVGKYRLARTPWVNHSWHATLYVTARGLTTSLIQYDGRAFQIDFAFIDHALLRSEEHTSELQSLMRISYAVD